MTRPVYVASAQVLQEVQSEAVRQGYDTPVCTYFETVYRPREVVGGRLGPIVGWLLLLDATTSPGRRPIRLRATMKVCSDARHIEIRQEQRSAAS